MKKIGLLVAVMLSILIYGCEVKTPNADQESDGSAHKAAEEILQENTKLYAVTEEQTEEKTKPQETPEEKATEVPSPQEDDQERMETDEEMSAGKYQCNDTVEVSVERIDKSIKNEEGQVLAIVYYEKPVLTGDTEAVKKINAFFDGEEEDWFGPGGRITGYSEDNYAEFLKMFEIMIEDWGEEGRSASPAIYALTTRIKYLDENTLSIMQIEDWLTGTHEQFYHGATFDLNTGELLPITKLADINPEGMRKILEATIDRQNNYDEMRSNDFVFHCNDQPVDMKYEYFYDGSSFYIIMNYVEIGYKCNGIILKWNGKWGEEYSMSKMEYYVFYDEGRLKRRID